MKCINCGNDVSNNDSVCPFCGTSRAVNQNMQQTLESKQSQNTQNYQKQWEGAFCVLCGKPIPSGYKMCPECMEKRAVTEAPHKKKKSYAVPVILIIVLLLALIATAGFFAYQNGLLTFIDEYQQDSSYDRNEDSQKNDDDADSSAGEDDNGDSASDNSDDTNDAGISEPETPQEIDEIPKESSYDLIVPAYTDRIVTWSEAEREAKNAGGHLVCINSQEEFDKITAMADEQELLMIWVGAKRASKEDWDEVRWLDGTKMAYTNWLANEPSYSSEGVEEKYLMILKSGGKWYFNDTYNDISEAYDVSTYSPKTAYIIEKEK